MKCGLYKHYKGHLYQVLGLARHSETFEEQVVYQALYGAYGLWVRPALMFQEHVILDRGEKVPRFQYIGPSLEKAPPVSAS